MFPLNVKLPVEVIRNRSVPAVDKPNTSEPGKNIPVFVSSTLEKLGLAADEIADLKYIPLLPAPYKAFTPVVNLFALPKETFPSTSNF